MRNHVTSLSKSKAVRRYINLLLRILTFVLILSILLQFILAYVVAKDPRILPPALRRAKNLLIVTAHPDDECLFFSPAILGVLDGNPDTTGGLIVLSSGNNYGLGEKRKVELKGSCKALSIDSGRCLALDKPDLQDNPNVWWDEAAITAVVRDYVAKWKVDVILTFDSGGVSGHINHRAVSTAVSHYAASDPKAPPTYTLTTTSLPRKYTFLLDLPLTSLSFSWRIFKALFTPANVIDDSHQSKALVASTWNMYFKTRQAFASHESQYGWDRNLYMIASRYVWFNDLRRVERRPA
ncbi:putative glycan biosynthesis protein [Hyaloscypha finlandica]|nr:putative glycan biosynthesis protein [Hyaloscypha finlandica]